MPQFPAPYLPLNGFVAPARPRPELWRTLCGLLIAGLFGFLAVQAVFLSLIVALGPERARSAAFDMATGASPGGVVALLFGYLPLTGGLALGLALMMRRGLFSLIGPRGPALGNFLRVALPLTGLWLILMPLSVMSGSVTPHLTLWQQLPWLPLALLGLVLQTGTEELIFRGYLQQQLAARFRSPLVWMVLPALVFGLAHYSAQQYGAVAWLVVAWSALFGLAAADLTARTGNLGAAVGLHFANNASAVLMVGLKGNLGGLALYTSTADPGDPGGALWFLVIDTVSLAIGWLSARLILRV